MANTVFIFGAGASVAAGAPLMYDFLDRAKAIQPKMQGIDKEAFELVFRTIYKLDSIYAKAEVDLINIESVFAVFEMINLLDTTDLNPLERINLIPSLKRLITQTIEHSMLFESRDTNIHAHETFENFAAFVGELKASTPGYLDFITFNYDVGLDCSLRRKNIICDDGLLGPSRLRGPHYLLKLHGSLNWIRCNDCEAIHTIPLQNLQFTSAGGIYRKTVVMSKGTFRCPGCNKDLDHEPMIVPPTFNKGQHFEQLRNLWGTAAKVIQQAENIIVCGYSLPPSDWFFKYLYALSMMGETWLKNILVVDPSTEVRNRFNALLGSKAKSKFIYHQAVFSHLYDYLKHNKKYCT